MPHDFDQPYWERHWRDAGPATPDAAWPVHPYLAVETAHLRPGAALEAGCGEGAEAIWLAERGWAVTAVDISDDALARARDRAARRSTTPPVTWVRADLETWDPGVAFDLVATHYAHPAGTQLDLYARLAGWVAPGGTLLVVGHRTHVHDHPDHDHPDHDHPDHDHAALGSASPASQREQRQPPVAATATAASVRDLLEGLGWEVVTALEPVRSVGDGAGRRTTLDDVVVRATRPGSTD